MNPWVFFAAILLLTAVSPFSGAARDKAAPPDAGFSSDDFDWREMVPYLYRAATQPGEQGLETILENSNVVRAYVAAEVRAECRRGHDRCDPGRPGFSFAEEVTKRIEGIVREGLLHDHKASFVNYSFADSGFAFSAVSVAKSDKRADAYFVLVCAPHTYTGEDVRSKYGAPYDTDVFDRYGVFKYKMDSAEYTSRAVFEINPANDEVMKIAISLRAKKRR